MPKNAQLKDLVHQTANRLSQDEEMVTEIVDTFLDEIYQTLKRGQGITIRNFGNFYLKPKYETWAFKFNPSQKWRRLFGWSSTYKGEM
jgi:DNA-binding protein HU-beta